MKLYILSITLYLISPLLAEEVSIQVEDATLKGQLNLAEKKTTRIAFLISGSGPTDRDGNTVGAPGKNNSLKYLSKHLNQGGIPTLRIDKRGVGASAKAAPKEIDLRFSTYVKDIGHWIKHLEKKGFTEIVLIGHSEGALVATLAAKHKSVIGLISIAGVGRSAPEILRSQLKPKLPKALYDQANEVITSLAEGKTVKNSPPSLVSLFRPSVQPYLISWFKINPVKAISELSVPILIVQGTSDLQTSLEDAKLLHEGSKKSKKVIIQDMNHVLKEIKGNLQKQLPSYFDPKIPLHKDLGNIVLTFVQRPQVETKGSESKAQGE